MAIPLLRRISLGQRLIASYFLLGFTILAFIFILYYNQAKNAIIERTFNQLQSVSTLKKTNIEYYINDLMQEVDLFSALYNTKLAYSEINSATKNAGFDSEYYQNAIRLFGHSLVLFKQFNHFENIWLVNNDGDVIYTNSKNDLFDVNFIQNQNINEELKKIIGLNLPSCIIVDVKYLIKGHVNPSLLIFSSIKSDNGSCMGYIVAKIDIEELNKILLVHTGMGNSGESYLIDGENLMRTRSRFIDNSDTLILIKSLENLDVNNHNISTNIVYDYRNIKVLNVKSQLQLKNLKWSIVTEIDYDEIAEPIENLLRKMIFWGIFICSGIIIFTFYQARRITMPIKKLQNDIIDVAKGVIPPPIEVQDFDEIGQITIEINKLKLALQEKAQFADEIGNGNFDKEFKAVSESDVLGHSLLNMRKSLMELENLQKRQNNIKKIAIIEGQEKERRRISMEIHDGIGQMLTAIKFKTQELKLEDDKITQLKKLVDETVIEVRRVAINLAPSVLYDFGLEPAIHALIKTYNREIDFRFIKDDGFKNISLDISIAIYRIVQEALQNIQKYANASKISVIIFNSSEFVEVLIEDNGQGFDFEQYTNTKFSNGIRNMRERCEILGGEFQIETALNIGTKIKLFFEL